MVGTAQDITEQKVYEDRSRHSSQRFTDLMEATPVGIGMFNELEQLVDANDALCSLLGISVEGLRGKTLERLAEAGEERISLAGLAASVAPRKPISRTFRKPDGQLLYCELSISVSVQDNGRRFWLVVFSDVTERRQAEENFRVQARQDDLTRLPNRTAVNENLNSLLCSETNPDFTKVALLFCDIDNFKRINDSLGHEFGDELLVSLARRIESELPSRCTVARWSSDEFVVICDNVDAVGGMDSLTAKVSAMFRRAVPLAGQMYKITSSIGAATPAETSTSAADLIRFADAAMYEAKKYGPGRVMVASDTLRASASHQMSLEGELRDALSNDGLELHFQPVVSADGQVQTAEALVRWPHPTRGFLAPDTFLKVAEQGDLMKELDRWVLKTALREAATWPENGGQQPSVAVNLAGLVPGETGFVDEIINAIADAKIAPQRVVLELVETSYIDLPARSRDEMTALSERGIRFAVDDFGTGYSNLARLKDLPAQIIKVDRSFVSGVDTDPRDLALSQAVVNITKAIGQHCVAEGVETVAQFLALREMGVAGYQGWLFSKAIPPLEFRALLENGLMPVPTE
jgi:diguanylate cyclase (GGDEF)-like protein/PAS domain S-box-containing protein